MLTLFVTGATAETTTPTTTQMPDVKGIAPEQSSGAQQLSFMGDEDAFLITDADKGTIDYELDAETKELSSMVARNGVILSSKNLTLNCDLLEYNNAKTELVATGRRVLLRYGDIIASCQLLTYNVTKQECTLTGKPTIYARNEKGVGTQTGNKIVIGNLNGKPTISVHGNAQAYNTQSKQKGVALGNYKQQTLPAVPPADARSAASGSSTPVTNKTDANAPENVGKMLGISTDPVNKK